MKLYICYREDGQRIIGTALQLKKQSLVKFHYLHVDIEQIVAARIRDILKEIALCGSPVEMVELDRRLADLKESTKTAIEPTFHWDIFNAIYLDDDFTTLHFKEIKTHGTK